MVVYKDKFENINERLTYWLQDIQAHELTDLVNIVEKAKEYIRASEEIPEEKLEQFIQNLKLDLRDFYQQQQVDFNKSPSVNVLNESLWQALEQVTDKSQVEWAELQADFDHDGVYRTGDFIGFGVLVCQQCHHTSHHSHFSEVIDCIECGHNCFTRQPLTP